MISQANALRLKQIVELKPKRGRIVKTCLAGSHAYNLDHEGSDLDVRGIFMLPKEDFWKLGTPDDEWEAEGHDAKWYELAKFFKLAAKGNPAVLEVLFTNPVQGSKEAQMIYDIRHEFLGKRDIYNAYKGFATGEIKSIQKDAKNENSRKLKRWKHVFRLIFQGGNLLINQEIQIRFDDNNPYRNFLMQIMEGKFSDEILHGYAQRNFDWLDMAYERSVMPEKSNADKLNEVLVKIRKGY